MLSLKLWKSIFLIVGTAIGAGILAIPITTAQSGFIGSVGGLIVCWGFMTLAAYFLLDVRLRFKTDVDLSTMTHETLGLKAKNLLKVLYLMLLFSLVSVYLIVGSAWIQDVLSLSFAPFVIQFGFAACMGVLIYFGVGNVATANHLVTTIMLMSLIFIICLSAPSVQLANLSTLQAPAILPTFPLLITAFGFSIILPSLTPFLNYDRKLLIRTLLIGSLVIVVVYILWEVTAFGVLGNAQDGLLMYANSQDKGTEVIQGLSANLGGSIFKNVGSAFMFTAIMSSLIGVGQCLFAYLKDVLPIQHSNKKSFVAITTAFIVPLASIQLYPAGVTTILGFAGIFVALILGVLPSLMVLRRKDKRPSKCIQALAYGTLIFFLGVIAIEIIP